MAGPVLAVSTAATFAEVAARSSMRSAMLDRCMGKDHISFADSPQADVDATFSIPQARALAWAVCQKGVHVKTVNFGAWPVDLKQGQVELAFFDAAQHAPSLVTLQAASGLSDRLVLQLEKNKCLLLCQSCERLSFAGTEAFSELGLRALAWALSQPSSKVTHLDFGQRQTPDVLAGEFEALFFDVATKGKLDDMKVWCGLSRRTTDRLLRNFAVSRQFDLVDGADAPPEPPALGFFSDPVGWMRAAFWGETARVRVIDAGSDDMGASQGAAQADPMAP